MKAGMPTDLGGIRPLDGRAGFFQAGGDLPERGLRRDGQGWMRLRRGNELQVDADVKLVPTGPEPAAASAGKRSRLGELLEAEQPAVEASGCCLTANRRRDLHMMDPDDSHVRNVMDGRAVEALPSSSTLPTSTGAGEPGYPGGRPAGVGITSSSERGGPSACSVHDRNPRTRTGSSDVTVTINGRRRSATGCAARRRGPFPVQGHRSPRTACRPR